MIRKSAKIVSVIIGALVGFGLANLAILLQPYYISLIKDSSLTVLEETIIITVFILLFGIIFFYITPLFIKTGQKLARTIETELRKTSGREAGLSVIGLIVGLLIATLVSQIYSGFLSEFGYFEIIINIVVYIIFAYIGIVVSSSFGTEIISELATTRRKIPEEAKTAQQDLTKFKKNKDIIPKIFDTSIIIDGRIMGIMKTGFLEGPIIIPEFVLVELRHIADSADDLKRVRGRRGLDILNQIREEYGIEIYNTESEKALKEIPEVDVKLLKLAQIVGGKVITNDYNLNKVAAVNSIGVLNINELTNTLKPVVLPGEEMTLNLIRQGKESAQAVGYLDDGTMIVVEDGRKKIGQVADIVVTSVLQTSAGRMIFGRLKK